MSPNKQVFRSSAPAAGTPPTSPTAPPAQKASALHKVLSFLGVFLCIVLTPILIINITLIIKSYTNQAEMPSIGRIVPMIVLTDSMYPEIHAGDLILGEITAPDQVAVGDTIAFFDPAGNGTSVVVHRVTEITTENGELAFITKGDANNAEDQMPVPQKNLVGVYKSRIAGLGNIAMFMQTTQGLVLCVLVPLAALVAYDMLRRRHYDKNKTDETAALLAQLEALKAQSGETETV